MKPADCQRPAGWPRAHWMPPAPGAMPRQIPPAARRLLGAVLVALLVAAALNTYLVKYRDGRNGVSVTHPNLVFMKATDGREVLLIGTVPVDLDEESSKLVRDALNALRPEVVMLEGTPQAGVQAMISSGRWEMRGLRKPNDTDWMNLDPELPPVEIEEAPKKWRFLPFLSGPGGAPERSIVPVKVSFWAYHLTSAVGGNIAAAVTAAANQGVPLRFLGPKDNGMLQGYAQVTAFAAQAENELLEEERRKGQLSVDAMNSALQNAEKHIRKDGEKWLQDARGESNRLIEMIRDKISDESAGNALRMMQELASFLADGVDKTMQDYHRGAVVVSVDKLPYVQDKLEQAGFLYLSQSTSGRQS